VRTPIPLQINTYGMLQSGRSHDATLDQLGFRDDTLKLGWSKEDGARYELALGAIHHQCVNAFVGKQILAEIYIWPLAEVSKAAAIPAAAWGTLLSSLLRPEKIPAEVTRITIQHPGASLVLCEFSYGGDIAVVCQQIQLWEVESPSGS
jgi:hypothetical protein